jgi:hypothetical protein
MAEYRIFFLDAKGGIEARQELQAEDDETAIALSTIVFQACSETYSGFELWSFDRQVMAATPGVGKLAEIVLDQIARDMQQRVLDFEDAIQRSHWRVAHSKKLLEATQTLRDVLARKEPGSDRAI